MLPQAKYLVTAIALFASDISAAPTVPAPGDDYPVFMVGKKGLEGRKSTPTATCQYAVWIGSGYWIGCLGKPADTTKVCPKDHPKDQGSAFDCMPCEEPVICHHGGNNKVECDWYYHGD